MPETTISSRLAGTRSKVANIFEKATPANQLGGLRGLIWSGRIVVMLGALITVAIGLTAGFAIWQGRQSALSDHLRGMNEMGIVLAEQTSRYAQIIDYSVQRAQSRIDRFNILTDEDFSRNIRTQMFQSYLADLVKNVPETVAIAVVDANGSLANWSRAEPVAHVNTAERDYFQHFKDHDDKGLFLASLSKSQATGKLSLFFARRASGADGRFIGVVLGIVEVQPLMDFYQTAGAQSEKAVTLLRRDGTMLIHYPDPEAAIGVRLPQGSPWYARVAEGGGTYITSGTLDNISSFVSVHPLRDYPLVIDVLMEEAEVLRQWHRSTVYITGFALSATIVLLSLFWVLARQFRIKNEQNTKLDAVLNNITQGVGFFDREQRLLLCNPRYAQIYDLPPELTRPGCSWADIADHRIMTGTAPDLPSAKLRSWRDKLAISQLPDGGTVALKNGRFVSINHQTLASGCSVATHEDVTERRKAEESIAFMARHDALTRLPNRILFRERMEQAIAMAGRGTQFAVFCLDLDRFKQVNDTLGHPMGDALLVSVADRLQACVREVDTVARLGGDEFAIIQLSLQQPDDAEVLASRITAAFDRPFEFDGNQIATGVSIGIAVTPGGGVSYETLMREADIALYLAKTEGRGTSRFFEPQMDARIHLRRVLEQDLQGAITRNEFEVYYQPQINLTSNRVSGFEALLRWHHPDRGLVSPAEFIPLAEETGLIVAIGEWVLRTACHEAKDWPDGVVVAVNLSPVQFKKGDLVKSVQAALDASGLQPDRLELEITETVVMHNTAGALEGLHQLRAMGICIALDDFGTGYSSLSYLHSFPFSKIKIDQSFVRDLTTSKQSMSIVSAVVGLGESLGMKILAEGVETKEQLDKLRNEGCTEVQGYYFSRPRPAAEVSAMIEGVQSCEYTKQSAAHGSQSKRHSRTRRND